MFNRALCIVPMVLGAGIFFSSILPPSQKVEVGDLEVSVGQMQVAAFVVGAGSLGLVVSRMSRGKLG